METLTLRCAAPLAGSPQLQLCLNDFSRDWFGKQEALQIVAVEAGQSVPLSDCFNAFGDDFHAQATTGRGPPRRWLRANAL